MKTVPSWTRLTVTCFSQRWSSNHSIPQVAVSSISGAVLRWWLVFWELVLFLFQSRTLKALRLKCGISCLPPCSPLGKTNCISLHSSYVWSLCRTDFRLVFRLKLIEHRGKNYDMDSTVVSLTHVYREWQMFWNAVGCFATS